MHGYLKIGDLLISYSYPNEDFYFGCQRQIHIPNFFHKPLEILMGEEKTSRGGWRIMNKI